MWARYALGPKTQWQIRKFHLGSLLEFTVLQDRWNDMSSSPERSGEVPKATQPGRARAGPVCPPKPFCT